MKKDIEWLKAQICTEMMYLEHIRKERWSGAKYQTLRSVSQKINQLDETEVLSLEWIDKHRKSYTMEDSVEISELQNLLVPKQELPVIPKYVADFIEVRKGTYAHSLLNILYVAMDRSEVGQLKKEYDWISANDETFARAWFIGYEVEEEQKYNVQLKARSSFGTVGVFLYKQGDEVLAGDNFKAYYPEEDKFRLTEQEIKDYDPRYWAFRKPVEELEECD